MIFKLSLTARLTVLFAAVSSAVLLSLGWLIGASIERHFEEQDRDILAGKLMLVRHTIERIATPRDIERLPSQLGGALIGHHDFMVRVLGPQGEVIFASSAGGFSDNWRAHAGATTGSRLFAWSEGGHSYRGLAASIPTGIAAWPPLAVAVAVDIGHHETFMATFMQTLWLFVAGAALASGLLGWFAARRGLAPLRAMRERAAQVTARKLDQRLPVEAVPAELADLAATLNEMLERLEEAFRRLSDFSSDLAHELRTPISNLMTQTQVSLSQARDAASYREILESNAEEFERLARMISDMLFLAKAENGLSLANCEQVDLASEVRDLFEFYEALADEKGVRLQLAGKGSVRGDRLMLRRALSNLLSNALRYTPRAGCVSVTIASEDAEAVLSVENPGEVIPPEYLARLFERFYRADPSRQQATGEGTGLGLAITRAIVEAHRGQISATSAAGRTCFMIRLPSN
ncbi:MAG: heavy metal sensor histidine kinase [Gallionellaceae bacterium]|nr:heavy metal sensor histidine kinase [Gallionellaceae bacterium]